MFGLRFSVSAGRCTRGAYIQLLPLNDSLRQMIDCDYVLIVDTEGLRAPELQLEGLKHDNELATFMIGLADATIINIFDETPGYLDDILQTSLHAFIRMRKVEMNPSCLFVHQNVPDVLADDKSKLGRQKFHDKLNDMTKAAAEVENCEGQYNSFNQVIDFDQSNDVFYFPSLWKGDPPMAPVNIGYSESAQKLKTALKDLTQRKQKCRCSLETFKLRVKNLWEAVLQENFVFSFKNTLEVCAYNEFDSQYAQWSWSLQSKMLEWEKTTRWKINGCDFTEKSAIEEVAEECIKEANEEILSTSYNAILTEMKSFINSSDHSETLPQWEHRIETRLLELNNKNKVWAKERCDSLVASRLSHAEIKKIEKSHITKIQGHIRKMVDEAWKTQKEYTKIETTQKFEAEWEGWMDDLKSKNKDIIYPSDHEIEKIIVVLLRELLQVGDAQIIEKLSVQPLNSRSLSLTLQVDKKIHLRSMKWFGIKPLSHDDVLTATKLTEGYLIEAREYLHTIQNESVQFSFKLVYKLLSNLISSVQDLMKPEKNSNFIFTLAYKVDLALVVCAYALDVFKQTMRKIKVDNDPMSKKKKKKSKLNGLKSTFLTYFEDEYNRVNNEAKAANGLCALLSKAIEEGIQTDLRKMIVDKMQKSQHKFSSKAQLKIQILKDLAINNRGFSRAEWFEHYREYLVDMRSCFLDWIKFYVKEYCNSKVTDFASEILSEKTDKITDTIDALCKPGCNIHNIQSWLDAFVEEMVGPGIIPLERSTMDIFVGECNVNEFSKYVLNGIEKIKSQIENKYSNKSWLMLQINSCSRSPHWVLYERLIGCTATCPFCDEQCDRTSPCLQNQNHSIRLHRYLSLGRWLFHGNNELVLRTCTDYVGTDESFRLSDGSLHKFHYREQIYKNWKIEPNTDTPFYWKWFVNKFHDEIETWIGASYTTISWDAVSQEDAIRSLSNIIRSY